MQLEEKDANKVKTGRTFVGTSLDLNYGETNSSVFAMQTLDKNSLHFGQAGDWVKVASNLSDLFAVVAATDYSMQLEEKDANKVKIGCTFVGTCVVLSYVESRRGVFGSQTLDKNSLHFG